jgi:hypothetical protein
MMLITDSGRRMRRKNNPMVRNMRSRLDEYSSARSGDVAELLTSQGLPHTPENLANKINCGGFSAGFMLQCFTALCATALNIPQSPLKTPLLSQLGLPAIHSL